MSALIYSFFRKSSLSTPNRLSKTLLSSRSSECLKVFSHQERCISQFPVSLGREDGLQNHEWSSVYKFQFIKPLASMNKLKSYHVIASIAAVPGCFFLPEVFDPTVISVLSVSGLATLSLASFIFKNTVGLVYTNQKTPDLVKFAFIDFWGRRQDVEMKIEDVVPVSELPKEPFDDYFTNLRFLNGHTRLKLFHKAGGISDYEEFVRVFGSN